MRLAYFSPLNPIASGISAYSEELLPLLAREFEIELIVEDYAPTNRALARFPIRTVREFIEHAREYDVILYHMGNSPAHATMYRTLLQIPGVVVLHDVVLHHLRAWQTLNRGDVKNYVSALRAAYGDAGAELATLEAQGLAALNRFDFPLNQEVVRAAKAIIVHSKYAAREIQVLAPNTPVAVIPMGVPPMAPISFSDARRTLNLPPDAFVVAAFGEIHPHKRVTIALEAFAEFHTQVPNSLFWLIGRESPNYDADAIIDILQLRGSVRRVGFAPKEDYEKYIAAADVCLNLRYPSAGETSASLLRLFAAGKAVLVTRTGAYAELPQSVCAKIEADEYERELVRAHLQFFACRTDVRNALGANAREFVARCHTLEQAAAAYADFLRAVAENRAGSKSYLKDWTAGSPLRSPAPHAGEAPRENRESSVFRLPSSVVPDAFRDSLARGFVELGLEADDPTLREVAQAIVELGLKVEAAS